MLDDNSSRLKLNNDAVAQKNNHPVASFLKIGSCATSCSLSFVFWCNIININRDFKKNTSRRRKSDFNLYMKSNRTTQQSSNQGRGEGGSTIFI